MTVGQLLDRIRSQYVSKFEAILLKEQKGSGRVLSELVMRDANGEPVEEGLLGLPMRIDLLQESENNSYSSLSIDSDECITFAPLEFEWKETLEILFQPFQWDSLTVVAYGTPKNEKWLELIAWFRKWFKAGNDGSGQILNVVHFLSDPSATSEGCSFQIDLGTAPIAAVEELFDAFKKTGIERIQIGAILQ
jgi:hypothetical protein